MDPFDRQALPASAPRPRFLPRCLLGAAAACALLAALALECDLYIALSEGRPPRLDAAALQSLLVSTGLAPHPNAP